MSSRAPRMALAIAVPLLFASAASAADSPRLALGGFDTVSYFTDNKPVPGKPDYQVVWHEANWQFASQEHLDLFKANPEKYAAQYDAHCAMGVGIDKGHKSEVDPEAYTIVNGKLYVNYDKKWADTFQKDTAMNISRADANWPTVKDMPEPVKK
jgi:hypothetical protein